MKNNNNNEAQSITIKVSFLTEMNPGNHGHLKQLVEDALKYQGIKVGEVCQGLIYEIV